MEQKRTPSAGRTGVAATTVMIAASAATVTTTCRADLIVGEFGTPVRAEFSTFAGAGFAPGGVDGGLDSRTWRVRGLGDGDGVFGGTHLGGDFARGLSGGGVTQGGVHAFEVEPGNVALGIQPGGADFTPGDITLRVLNGTGSALSSLILSYAVYVLNDEDRSGSFNLSWSLDDATWVDVPSLDLVSDETAAETPAWAHHGRGTRLTGLDLAAGDALFLRWTGDDVGGTGARDEFALDEVSLLAVPGPGGAVLLLLAGAVGRRRRRRSVR